MEQRRLRRGFHVRLRGEQADQPGLAHDEPSWITMRTRCSPCAPGDARSSREFVFEKTNRSPSSMRAHHVVEIDSGVMSASAERRTSLRMPSPLAGTPLSPPGPHRRCRRLVLAIASRRSLARDPLEEVDRLTSLLGRVPDGRRPEPARSCAERVPASARSPEPRAGRRAGSRHTRSSSLALLVGEWAVDSKCMTDSRWLASRPDMTRSMCPCSSRTVPTTG